MSIRIALVGKSKTGRSACATYLEKKHKFKRMGLEDGVREVVKKLYGIQAHKRIPWERRAKIYDALYKVDSDIWINYLARRLSTTTLNTVVDDVRYLNEVDVLKELGFTLVRITAPENVRVTRIPTLTHAAAGSVLAYEWFNKDFTAGIKAEYTIVNSNRLATYKSIDELVKNLT